MEIDSVTKPQTPWAQAQNRDFPPPQSPAQMGLKGSDPASKYHGQPYPAATLELEGPYYLRRCRMALKEIAEAWQVLVELGIELPDIEARIYQRITERYVQFAEDAK